MKLTERDGLVLAESARFLVWFGLLGWMLHYSFWLGGAFCAYATFYNQIGLHSTESLKTFRREI